MKSTTLTWSSSSGWSERPLPALDSDRTLVVVFGVQPGLLLNLIQGSVDEFLASARTGQAIPVDPIVVVIGLALIVLLVVARTVAVALGRRRETTVVVAQGGGV